MTKREIAFFHVETAWQTRKMQENRDHVVIFAVRVSRIAMLNNFSNVKMHFDFRALSAYSRQYGLARPTEVSGP